MSEEVKVIVGVDKLMEKGAISNILWLMNEVVNELKANKPNDRSEKDRKFAVVITEAEKLSAIARGFLT